MRKWLFRIALVCVVFVAVWAVMVVIWQDRNDMPDTADVLMYMVVLPVALIATVAIAAKIRRQSAAAADSEAAAAQAPSEGATEGKDNSPAQERSLTLTLLASALRVAHGEAASALSEAMMSNAAKPALDPELTDADGFPILSVRVPDLDDEAQRERLAAWQISHGLPELTWSSEQLRATAMGASIVTELGQAVSAHPLLEEYMAAKPAEQASIALPTLQLIAMLPSTWEQAQRQSAGEWLLDLIAQQGWPREKIMLSPLVAGAPAGPLGVIDRLSLHAYRQSLPCLAILFACESHIGEQTLAEWASAGKLLTATNEAGQIPGEGAAGLLLADADQARQWDLDSMADMHRVAQGRRDKSADAAGRISADFLTGLSVDALAVANASAEEIALVAADTDHRASRMAELMEMAHSSFPDLDLKKQCLQVAAGCGAAGAASTLIALALAHHEAASNGNRALCISNCDGFERAAVVISPKSIDPVATTLAA